MTEHKITLAWHQMFCWMCLSTNLHVRFTGTARLTGGGSEDVGDHEWNDDSETCCQDCQALGPARMFKFGEVGNSGETITVPWRVTEDGDDCPDISFEIQLLPMTEDDEGSHITQDGEQVHHFDVVLNRRFGDQIHPLIEREELKEDEAYAVFEALQNDHPDASAENLH